MLKRFIVLYVIVAAALGLVAGLFTVAMGETSVPAVAIAVVSGMFLAGPCSWYASQSRCFG